MTMRKCDCCGAEGATIPLPAGYGPAVGAMVCVSTDRTSNCWSHLTMGAIIAAVVARREAAKDQCCEIHEFMDSGGKCVKCGATRFAPPAAWNLSNANTAALPNVTLEETQRKLTKPAWDPYAATREAYYELALGNVLAGLHDMVCDLRCYRQGEATDGFDTPRTPTTLAAFRKDAPALLAELVKEVAKL